MHYELIIRLGQASIDFAWSAAGQDKMVYAPYEMNGSISLAAHLREALGNNPPPSPPQGRGVNIVSPIGKSNQSSLPWGGVGGGFKAGGGSLVMVSSPTMLVPVDEFVATDADMLYRHVFPKAPSNLSGGVVGYSVVPMLDTVALFAIDKDVHRVVSETFAEARFLPVMQPLWEYLSHHAPLQFNVCFLDGSMHVFSVRNNRFRFCNSFEVGSADDAAYLSLNAWTQLGMDAEYDVFCVVGQPPGDGRFEQTVRRYVRKVYVRNLVDEIGLPEPLRGMPLDMQALMAG